MQCCCISLQKNGGRGEAEAGGEAEQGLGNGHRGGVPGARTREAEGALEVSGGVELGGARGNTRSGTRHWSSSSGSIPPGSRRWLQRAMALGDAGEAEERDERDEAGDDSLARRGTSRIARSIQAGCRRRR